MSVSLVNSAELGSPGCHSIRESAMKSSPLEELGWEEANQLLNFEGYNERETAWRIGRQMRNQTFVLFPFAVMSNQPNTTLYINNLNDQVNKDELRSQLYALFTTYGKIIDVIASKGPKKRGQAFLVFADLAGATSALRGCEGMVFYDKPMVGKIKHNSGRDPDFFAAH
jgi:RNA recognition motif-containing protein